MPNSAIYKLALSFLPGIGPRLARSLVAYVGSVEGVFKEKKHLLAKVPGIGEIIASKININTILAFTEKELEFITANAIHWVFFLDKDYPFRLKECEDSPVVLFYKGENCFDAIKAISIVGTRRSTRYGDSMCEKLVSELAVLFPELLIVSGFAYGIDIAAHKAALKANLKTVAVFGHGLDMVYPSLHKKYVKQVLEMGAFVTEFPSQKKLDPGNFVSRNRIIAGLADCAVVIESGEKGGALLTADMANSYNRDVFAFPGRAEDNLSRGCNMLIKQNKAVLIESASDLVSCMRWDIKPNKNPVQKVLFEDLSDEEIVLLENIKLHESITLDDLTNITKLPVSRVSSTLLTMEFKGLISALPGKAFKLS